jgi:hypothetical protein
MDFDICNSCQNFRNFVKGRAVDHQSLRDNERSWRRYSSPAVRAEPPASARPAAIAIAQRRTRVTPAPPTATVRSTSPAPVACPRVIQGSEHAFTLLWKRSGSRRPRRWPSARTSSCASRWRASSLVANCWWSRLPTIENDMYSGDEPCRIWIWLRLHVLSKISGSLRGLRTSGQRHADLQDTLGR